jgi:hypothetical protein
MGDVLDLKPRLVVVNDKPVDDGLVLACHCGQTLHEIINNGIVRCARCRCEAPITWGWKK